MRKPTVKCALLAALIAKHPWGAPIGEENLLRVAAIDDDGYPIARELFNELRSEPYVINAGKRGIQLDHSRFGAIAEILYQECAWEPFQIKSRLKHYEGWDDHEWA